MAMWEYRAPWKGHRKPGVGCRLGVQVGTRAPTGRPGAPGTLIPQSRTHGTVTTTVLADVAAARFAATSDPAVGGGHGPALFVATDKRLRHTPQQYSIRIEVLATNLACPGHVYYSNSLVD
jgi:hypothetical protein